MADLSDQILWEQECSERGSASYYANQDRLKESGNGDTAEVSSYLIRTRLEEVAEFIKVLANENSKGRGAHYNHILRLFAGEDEDYMKISYIALKSVLRAVQVPTKSTVLKVLLDMSNRIEVELKCQLFEKEKPAYFDTVRKSFAEQNLTDFVHKQKVMMKKFNEFDIAWSDWAVGDKIQIGSRLLRGILAVFDDVFVTYMAYDRGKTIRKLTTTPKFDEWAKEFEKERGLLHPVFLPLKVPPVAWTDLKTGGYHTNKLRSSFIKTKTRDHRRFTEKHIPVHHMNAVNKMQRTAWRINTDVLQVQEEIYSKGLGVGMPSNKIISPPEFPPHLQNLHKEDLTVEQKEEIRAWKLIAKRCYHQEQKRKGQVLAFIQGHKLAKELREWDKLYFVYTCDFRGRIYCATSGLSPQGADTAKGLLTFAQGVRLGERGVHWLAIHGANVFGIDKVSYDERVQWTMDHSEEIRRVAEDPVNTRSWWGDADKPYQFLAFCLEWAASDCGKNKNYESHLPVGLDGTCNGLQHYSAMLKDEVGARATNLVKTDKPADIYADVAKVVMRKLREDTDPRAKTWLRVGVTRKCTKHPVMTLPYGAKQSSMRLHIMDYAVANWAKFQLDPKHQWEYTNYLTPIVWDAIGEVVIAARAAMDWIQANIGTGYVSWLTPVGFPVYQFYKDVPQKRVATQLEGSVEIYFRDMNLMGKPKSTLQRSGIAPNFVHSVDSTHLVMTVNSTDLISYAMIHDDFGTHAGHTDVLFKAIRKSFLHMYTKHNLLEEWAEQVGADPTTLPPVGSYNIQDIKEASYFFG